MGTAYGYAPLDPAPTLLQVPCSDQMPQDHWLLLLFSGSASNL